MGNYLHIKEKLNSKNKSKSLIHNLNTHLQQFTYNHDTESSINNISSFNINLSENDISIISINQFEVQNTTKINSNSNYENEKPINNTFPGDELENYNKNIPSILTISKDKSRINYINHLIRKNIWRPHVKVNHINSIVIFDFEDTLFPSTFLNKYDFGYVNNEKDIANFDEKKFALLSKVEYYVVNIIHQAVSTDSDVYIVSNSGKEWVMSCINDFLGSLNKLIDKIHVVSSKSEVDLCENNENNVMKMKRNEKINKRSSFFKSRLSDISLLDMFSDCESKTNKTNTTTYNPNDDYIFDEDGNGKRRFSKIKINNNQTRNHILIKYRQYISNLNKTEPNEINDDEKEQINKTTPSIDDKSEEQSRNDNYENKKIKVFREIGEKYCNVPTNILNFGDSVYDIQACDELGKMFSEKYIKNIKFKESPSIREHLKELSIVNSQFEKIFSQLKSVVFKFDKK